MNKELVLDYISNSMSLRPPQEKSLRLFADYLDSPAGKNLISTLKRQERKPTDYLENTAIGYFTQINETKNFKGFDGRSYPTFTYALATGVGKTRLMGAFVTYLYLVYGIKHFMIVAPGNTIYRKLLDDFGKSNNPKYVFKGIAELNSSNIKIIHKDNYTNQNHELSYYKNNIEINILNIQQFSQKDIEKQKGITKGSENFGVKDGRLLSYFDYLSDLDDLVVLLDESHHYHADAAFQSLDRLSPLFGLEFTATPYTGELIGKGKEKAPKMKDSIVYLYNLGDAIKDGFVKNPWLGTEADVDFSKYKIDDIETDLKKLQLAVYFHERAKTSIKSYSLENDKKYIKPVMFIIAKDIPHAEELLKKIDSKEFYGGEYIGKVIAVHSKNPSDNDSTLDHLLSLEHPKNYIEVVIHVNMLKEGWDVANIYTIVPLRSSAAQILTEQTIGRGLRLPYGEKTGNELVDKVIIVAHEKYQEVLSKAKDSDLLNPTNTEKVSLDEQKNIKTIIEAKPILIEKIEERIEENIKKDIKIQNEINIIVENELKDTVLEDTPVEVKQNAIDSRVNELTSEIAKVTATFNNSNKLDNNSLDFSNEGTLFSVLSAETKENLNSILKISLNELSNRNIFIPRLDITPQYGSISFNDFNLDTSKLKKYPLNLTVMETQIQQQTENDMFNNQRIVESPTVVNKVTTIRKTSDKNPEEILLSAVLRDLIDYEEQKFLLLKLCKQAVDYYKKFSKDNALIYRVIFDNVHEIADEIYSQLMSHSIKVDSYLISNLGQPKPTLEQHNITSYVGEPKYNLSFGSNFSKDKIYTNFSKSCHSFYRFDSSDELKFAFLLEGDFEVLVWLRPAPKQFETLRWRDEFGNADRKYEPDFVVELENETIIVEIKPSNEIDDFDVNAKKETVERYCELINQNIGKFNINKHWRYVIVPTEKILINSTIKFLLS